MKTDNECFSVPLTQAATHVRGVPALSLWIVTAVSAWLFPAVSTPMRKYVGQKFPITKLSETNAK